MSDLADSIKNRDLVINYYSLPGIPKLEWDGESSFSRGVCVLLMRDGSRSYACCAYDVVSMQSPCVTKVFSLEPFVRMESIYVIPEYMSTESDIAKMDLDDVSRSRASEILSDARELEESGADDVEEVVAELPEWVFDEIHNRDEAIAWLKSYNKSHRIKGGLPRTDETLKLRLLSIRKEMDNKNC